MLNKRGSANSKIARIKSIFMITLMVLTMFTVIQIIPVEDVSISEQVSAGHVFEQISDSDFSAGTLNLMVLGSMQHFI
jgi:hypothetical protein